MAERDTSQPPIEGGTTPDPAKPLRLRAEDPEDLAVISTILQDALMPVGDLAYERAERRFMLVANRFRWEGGVADAAGDAGHERVHCALAFQDVLGVAYRGFRRGETDRILSLLALCMEPSGDIVMEFSGGEAIRLSVVRLHCLLRDLGEPWPTVWRPAHDGIDLP